MTKRAKAPPPPPRSSPGPQPFPPRRDFASLSIRDLLEARDAYHVHMSRLPNVVATAIGRYLIHERDWYAIHPPDDPRPAGFPLVAEARTLANTVVRPWSWPAVLVFVRRWQTAPALGADAVPRRLYLPDGRVIPTCVVLAEPDETPPPPAPGPSQVSGLLGGGYSVLREHQGVQNVGTVACLVKKDGSYYALTSRHVAGGEGEEVRACVRGTYRRVGRSSSLSVGRLLLASLFPSWPGDHTYLNLDAALVRIDDVGDWTAQVFGVGEVGEAFDATEESITLDLVGCPVRAFGAASGVMEGQIHALFFRYLSLGGFDHATDVLIGPRRKRAGARAWASPLTRPGDSGALWFYDPARKGGPDGGGDVGSGQVAPERGPRARRLRPIAMQWGGERFRLPGGSANAFALGSFVSSVCRALDVEVVRDWSTGHDEYWGKIGHFAIGWRACDQVTGPLGELMKKNQAIIGCGDDRLREGAEFRMARDGFVPLADVPDYVWVNSRPNEPIQHFADIDIEDIEGGPSLLARCVAEPKNVSAKVWKQFFDGFAQAGVGPEEGALPFRVWQIWEAMVSYLKERDVKRFVAAAGVLAHYVGDASQPLHCSYLHHGVPPMVTVGGREYPVPRDSDEFKAFKATRAAKVHAIYEETMLEVDAAAALAAVDEQLGRQARRTLPGLTGGHGAAMATVRLMHEAQERLPPRAIIDADDPGPGPKARAEALWANPAVRSATITSLAESVRLLASLWSSAWEAGGGDRVARSRLVAFEEGELDDVYRRDRRFVPSLSLGRMAASGQFEPPES